MLITGVKVPANNIVENRILAEKPDFSNTAFTELPHSYETYLNDNLPFRTQFIANYIRIWEMGLSSFVREKVKGKGDQYFPNIKVGATIENFLGLHPISLEQLYSFRTMIAGRQAFWQSKGAEYLYMLLPDKATLYPEFLPGWIQHKYSWFDQMSAFLENTEINYFDIKKQLTAKKNPERPFYNKFFDTVHWNGNALDLVYKEISEKFKTNPSYHQVAIDKVYQVKPREVEEFPFGKEVVPWIKLAINNLRVLPHDYNKLKRYTWGSCDIIQNDSIKTGTLLLAMDSYFKFCHQDIFKGTKTAVFPFVHNVHKFIGIEYAMNFEVFEKIAEVEKPDIVIEASVERVGPNISLENTPRLLIAGDRLLDESLFILTPQFLALSSKHKNYILMTADKGIKVVAKNNDPIIHLPPQKTNKKGRFVVMVKMHSPVNTFAQLYYAQDNDSFSDARMLSKSIKKGINYLHFSVYARPDNKIRLRFDPGAKKTSYTIFPMPNIKEMFEAKL